MEGIVVEFTREEVGPLDVLVGERLGKMERFTI